MSANMNVVSNGHLRVTIGDTVVEIIGQGRLYVATFSGRGATPTMTYGERPIMTLREVIGQVSARAVPPQPSSRGTDFTALPASIEKGVPKPALKWGSKASIKAADSAVAKRKPYKPRRNKTLYAVHEPGLTAPRDNNPIRYAVRLVQKRNPPRSQDRLDDMILRVHKITKMSLESLSRREGETMLDTYNRVQNELGLWFDAYEATLPDRMKSHNKEE